MRRSVITTKRRNVMFKGKIAATMIAGFVALAVVLGAGVEADAHHLYKTGTAKIVKAPVPDTH